jgi:hypothetical protein
MISPEASIRTGLLMPKASILDGSWRAGPRRGGGLRGLGRSSSTAPELRASRGGESGMGFSGCCAVAQQRVPLHQIKNSPLPHPRAPATRIRVAAGKDPRGEGYALGWGGKRNARAGRGRHSSDARDISLIPRGRQQLILRSPSPRGRSSARARRGRASPCGPCRSRARSRRRGAACRRR